jgi:hypothetical protein
MTTYFKINGAGTTIAATIGSEVKSVSDVILHLREHTLLKAFSQFLLSRGSPVSLTLKFSEDGETIDPDMDYWELCWQFPSLGRDESNPFVVSFDDGKDITFILEPKLMYVLKSPNRKIATGRSLRVRCVSF